MNHPSNNYAPEISPGDPVPVASLETNIIEGQKRPSFNILADDSQATELSTIVIDESAVHAILLDKQKSEDEKTTELVAFVFDNYTRVVPIPGFTIDDLNLGSLLLTARYIQRNLGNSQSYHKDISSAHHITIESNMEIIAADLDPISDRTPLVITTKLKKLFPLKKEVQLAHLAATLWTAENCQLGLENLTKELHGLASAVHPKKQSGGPMSKVIDLSGW